MFFFHDHLRSRDRGRRFLLLYRPRLLSRDLLRGGVRSRFLFRDLSRDRDRELLRDLSLIIFIKSLEKNLFCLLTDNSGSVRAIKVPLPVT